MLTVSVYDDSTGDTQTVKVPDDEYFIICTGGCYVSHTQVYPKTGTHVLTIKGRRELREFPKRGIGA